jgi:hypothetical protein
MTPQSSTDSGLLLLVEGVNDRHAISQLVWLVDGTDPAFVIHDCGNDDKVLESLAAGVVGSRQKQRVLGVVLDSDIDGVAANQVIGSRLDQIKARVGDYYDLPPEFPPGGLVVKPKDAARLPKLGVWLMPDNRAYGMFEDLLLRSLHKPAAEYTEAVVRKAKSDGHAGSKDAHVSKAIVRTFIAWQDPKIDHIGVAIRAGTFQNIEIECKQFLDWLSRLFGTA